VYAVGGFGTFLERQQEVNGLVTWKRSSEVSTRFYLRAITSLDINKMIIGGGAGTLQVMHEDGSGRLVIADSQEGE
jgi:hypothetical protein